MIRVLLIKLSSMGDLIHTLPAITDVMHNAPEIEFDWVVEPSFSEIAAWHPSVKQVFNLPLRSKDYSAVWDTVKKIRCNQYDYVIDAQGLLKSAIFARLVKTSKRIGFDWQSCREGPASLLYNQKIAVPWGQHAVIRLRQMFAKIFSYQYDQDYVDYGVHWHTLTKENVSVKQYVVFLHGTTWESKHWPNEYWVTLADILAAHGLEVRLTWANAEQKARAEMLRDRCKNVVMLPHLTLNEALTVLHHAHAVVAVDTGFAHLSAALNKPLVAIYGPTDVVESGTVSNRNINLSSKLECAPCVKRICQFNGMQTINPPCFKEITPIIVWKNLQGLLAKI